jgi:flagellar motor switch protein FliM
MSDAENKGTASQQMSQSEIETLLSQVGGGDLAAVGSEEQPVSGEAAARAAAYQPYEFKQNSLLSTGDLRKLRLRHEEFVGSLAQRYSSFLHTEFTLKMSKLEVFSFPKFIESLADPTHLVLFDLEGIPGTCFLEVPPRLGLSIVDRRAGGPGHCPESVRNMSPIEIGLLEKPTEMILEEWCALWKPALDLRTMIIEHETNGRFLDNWAPTGSLLLLVMEACISGLVEQIQLAIPLTTLKPLLQTIESRAKAERKAQETSVVAPPRWNAIYDDLNIEIAAALPPIELTTRDLVNLQIGDVLPFKHCIAHVCIEKEPRFLGDLGNSGGYWAVKLIPAANARTAPSTVDPISSRALPPGKA